MNRHVSNEIDFMVHAPMISTHHTENGELQTHKRKLAIEEKKYHFGRSETFKPTYIFNNRHSRDKDIEQNIMVNAPIAMPRFECGDNFQYQKI